MNMVAHYHIGIDLQPFVFLTILQILNNNIPVAQPGKYVNPFNNLEGYEMQLFLVFYLVSGSHRCTWLYKNSQYCAWSLYCVRNSAGCRLLLNVAGRYA